MTLLESMLSQEGQRGMKMSTGSLSYEDEFSRTPAPDPDPTVYEYTLTINSKVDKAKKDQPSESPYPDGRDGIRSTFTAYKNGVSHLGTAVKGCPGGTWDPVPGEQTQVAEFYPITEASFTWFPQNKPGQWDLKAGPFCLELEGSAYDPMQGHGMGVTEFALSEWRRGKMSIVGVKALGLRDDPRSAMRTDVLRGAFGASIASYLSLNGTSASENRARVEIP